MNKLNEEIRAITNQIRIYNKKLKKTTDPQVQWDLSRKISELEVERDLRLKELQEY